MLVEFVFRKNGHEVEGMAALYFNKNDTITMTDEELLKEIKTQYGYEAIKVIHKQKKKV